MDWDDIRHFLALARMGSVRSAGASLGVSHSTVARRVEALEARLAARLFDRSRDGYTLTEAGRQMLPGAQRVEREMAALELGLVGQDERLAGPVVLTCTDAFVSRVLVHGLRPFCEAHPDIELCISIDSRSYDLTKREADLAVRAVGVDGSPPAHLLGRRLVPVTLANYVGRGHAERLDPDLPGTHPRWLGAVERKTMDAMVATSSHANVPIWGSFSSMQVRAQAARAGLGLVMLPTYVGDRDPCLQRLRRPDVRHVADLWLLCHADLRDNVRFRAARKQVAAVLTAELPLFGGDLGPAAD